MPKEPCRRNSALPGGMKEAAGFRETTCAVAASCVFSNGEWDKASSPGASLELSKQAGESRIGISRK